MTRGEMRRLMRNKLGERTSGYWQDAVLNDIIQQAADRHAREGLSVERSRHADSIPGVQEYDFPSNYGQLIAVRYNDESYGYEGDQLTLVDKSAILDSGYNYNFLGYPQYYYVFDDGFGLFPVPNKPPIFDFSFTGRCPGFTPPQNPEINHIYRTTINLDIDPEDDDDEDCFVFVSNVGLYLRRVGIPRTGELYLNINEVNDDGTFTHITNSAPVFTEDISTRPNWYTFDFSNAPLELRSSVKSYDFLLFADQDYGQAIARSPAGTGINIGTQTQTLDDGTTREEAFFQLHRFRDDIEIDYWAHDTTKMATDDDSPEQQERFHEDIFEIALADAWTVGGRNMRLAEYHESRAIDRINQSRTNQLKKAHGRRIRTERITLANVPYATYDAASDAFTISILGQ